nr:hypothetical protein [Kofleriaceae bacterium]
MVASSSAARAESARMAAPPQAPHAPIPDGAVATWLSLQLLGHGSARISLQLSRDATAREEVVDDRTLVVQLDGFQLSRTGTWGHVDMAAYDSDVESLDIEPAPTATVGVELVVRFKQPGRARAGMSRVALADDGYHYLVVGVGVAEPEQAAAAAPAAPGAPAAPTTVAAATEDDSAPPVVILRRDQILIGPDTKYGPRVNVSAAVGYNGPAGAIGVDVDYRVTHHIAVGLAGGVGAWGPRVTPNAKLQYHFPGGEVFLEGGVGLNFGGHITDTLDGVDHSYQAGFVPTADLAIGFRKRVWVPWLWTGLQIGTSFALMQNRFTVDHAGDAQSMTDAQALYPGVPPILIAFSSGFSF